MVKITFLYRADNIDKVEYGPYKKDILIVNFAKSI